MRQGLLFILSLIAIASLFDTINQLCLKSAINSLDSSPTANIKQIIHFVVKLIIIPRVWLSFLFAILSLCVWLFVLSKVDLNFAFSVDSMHYIFIAVASRLFLREKVDSRRWFGTILIVVGIALVSLG